MGLIGAWWDESGDGTLFISDKMLRLLGIDPTTINIPGYERERDLARRAWAWVPLRQKKRRAGHHQAARTFRPWLPGPADWAASAAPLEPFPAWSALAAASRQRACGGWP